MAKVEQIVSSLQKLYVKRGALDKQIVDVEKKLVAETKKASAKPAATKKPAGKKSAAKKSAAKKPAAKPLLKK